MNHGCASAPAVAWQLVVKGRWCTISHSCCCLLPEMPSWLQYCRIVQRTGFPDVKMKVGADVSGVDGGHCVAVADTSPQVQQPTMACVLCMQQRGVEVLLKVAASSGVLSVRDLSECPLMPALMTGWLP